MCTLKSIHMASVWIFRHVLSVGWAWQHRCVYVSPESNKICCHLTARKTQYRVSSFSPSVRSLSVFPLSDFLLLFGTLKLLQSSFQALHASRVQLVLQTICSQHTVHNPAPVMQPTLWCFLLDKQNELRILLCGDNNNVVLNQILG